jgi:predicted DNA-binding transcriptional regulator AlpA
MRSTIREPLPELVSAKDIRAALGISASTLHRLRRAGRFPEPVPISPGRVAWKRAAVERWIADRFGDSDQPEG